MSWQSSFCAHSKVREHRRKNQHYVITPPSLIQHHATPPTLPNFSFVATFPSPSKNASPIVSTSSSRVMGTASVTGPLLYDNVREGIRYILFCLRTQHPFACTCTYGCSPFVLRLYSERSMSCDAMLESSMLKMPGLLAEGASSSSSLQRRKGKRFVYLSFAGKCKERTWSCDPLLASNLLAP